MRHFIAALIVSLVIGWSAAALYAQEQTLLSLEAPTTNLQTGQPYDVNIRIDGAPEIWLADIQISYDPALVYIIGTKSGSPVKQGAYFNPAESVVARNQIQDNLLIYTVSLLAPAEQARGSGVVGTVRIYPLAPGTTQLLFTQAELDQAIFEVRDGQRVGVGVEKLPFTPVLLELTITGNPVEPPSEATATPLPTETPLPPPTVEFPTTVPTLVNVTAAPRTPEPLTTLEAPTASSDTGSNVPIILGIGLMLAGATGFVVILMMRRRKGL